MAQYRDKEEELILAFMNSRSKYRQFTSADVSLYVAAFKRDGGLRAGFKYYEAFEADEAFVAQADKSGLQDLLLLPPAAAEEMSYSANSGRRECARPPRHPEGCEHWIFEENPAETLAALVAFLSEPSH